MRSRRLSPHPLAPLPTPQVTYNTLIDLYVKTGQWQEAIKVLDKLEEEVREGEGAWGTAGAGAGK